MLAALSRPAAALVAAGALALTTLAVASPASAATRPGAGSPESKGGTTVLVGKPTSRQKAMTDLYAVNFSWERFTADSEYLAVNYRTPHRKGNPVQYKFRDDITVRYTAGGDEHVATIVVDPSDTSAGPWGRYDFEGPHAAAVEEAGGDCSPYHAGMWETGRSSSNSIGFPVECLGDLERVEGIALVHTTRHGGAQVRDRATIGDGAPKPLAAWRTTSVSDRKGDATYSPWRLQRFADLRGASVTYAPAADELRVKVKLRALSTGRRQPRQQLSFYTESRNGSYQPAVAFVPRSAGKAGSFSLRGCDGERFWVDRKARAMTLALPGSCVAGGEFQLDLQLNTFRKGRSDSSDSLSEFRGVVLS